MMVKAFGIHRKNLLEFRMVTFRKAERMLSLALCEQLRSMGFNEVQPLRFLRKDGSSVSQTLTLALREKLPGVFGFGCGVGVRFAQIETVIGNPGDSPTKPTIGMPLHLLRPDRDYFEWEFLSECDFKELISSVIGNIRQYALPFFERYSSIRSVQEALESPFPTNHFMLQPEERALVLAGVYCVEGRIERAIDLLDAERIKRTGQPASYGVRLLLLKRRLQSKLN